MSYTDTLVIAVVDDELPVRIMLGRVLRLAGFEVSAFASGQEFLASLAQHVPACVILDIHMPGLSGLEVQSRLRATHVDVPVLFITASDDIVLERSAHDGGAAYLLRKPFRSDELLQALDVTLGARRPSA